MYLTCKCFLHPLYVIDIVSLEDGRVATISATLSSPLMRWGRDTHDYTAVDTVVHVWDPMTGRLLSSSSVLPDKFRVPLFNRTLHINGTIVFACFNDDERAICAFDVATQKIRILGREESKDGIMGVDKIVPSWAPDESTAVVNISRVGESWTSLDLCTGELREHADESAPFREFPCPWKWFTVAKS